VIVNEDVVRYICFVAANRTFLWGIYNSVKQNDVEVHLRCSFLQRVLWRS